VQDPIPPTGVPADDLLAGITPAPATAACGECGRTLPRADMIPHGELWICASCKPVFVQKLKEGVALPGAVTYAGFWIRAGAAVLDGILLWVVNTIVSLPFLALIGASATGDGNPALALAAMMASLLVQLGIGVSYEVWFIGRYGATPGKFALRLRVVTSEGSRVTYSRSFGRYFAKILSGLTLGIGFLLAAFDEQKRALHDRICDTRVVRR
jgi:uncharacterized RDD family membrane protein YckC